MIGTIVTMIKRWVLERKLTAILCADVYGYSRLMGENEEGTLRTLSAYSKITSSLIERYHGRFVNSAGDSVLAEFASVVEAVSCAVAIQTTIKAENAQLPADRRMQFRIGVNLGDVMVKGEQIYGDGVNVAARLESLADPGGISISGTVHDQVRDKLELTYEDRGEQMAKNIARPVRVWRVLLDQAVKPQRKLRRYPRGAVLSLAGAAFAIVTFVIVQHLSLRPRHTSASIPPLETPALTMPSIPSIAVLPFTNLSGDPDQEYFSDGITDNLITGLSRLPGVLVIARNSSFFYKGKAMTLRQIGRELGVRTILQGSVIREATRIRINAQLADAANGTNVWAQSFDQPLKDIFAVQDGIVQGIVKTLSEFFKLDSLRVPRQAPLPHTDNLEAFEDLLRGSYYSWRFTKEGNEKARDLFERAIELDRKCADAYAGLGWTYSNDLLLGSPQNPVADLERSSELAQKALALDDSNVSALTLVSRNDFHQRRFDQAVADGRRAVALSPNYAAAYYILAQALAAVGNREEAILNTQKAIRLDPESAEFYSVNIAEADLVVGRYQEAVPMVEKFAATYPNALPAHLLLIFAYTELGRNEEARAQAAEVMRINPKYRLWPFAKSGWPKDSIVRQRYYADLCRAGLKPPT